MKNATLSRVYAEALLDLAGERGQLLVVGEEMETLEKIFQEDRVLLTFLESPNIDRKERGRVLEIAFRGKVSDTTLDFLLLVVRRGREAFLLEMFATFRALYETKAGLVRVTATTAAPMIDALRDALQASLEARLHKKVLLSAKVDADVLGGIVLRYEDNVIDGSLRRSLSDLKSTLRNLQFPSELIHEDSP
jgi:F-type H+-transporting ATPase subunit delta